MANALQYFRIDGEVADSGIADLGDGWIRPWVKLASGTAEPDLSVKATFGGMIGDLSLVPDVQVVAALFRCDGD